MIPGVLSRRALNRALLARQHLLQRADLPVADLLEHLVGLQAQSVGPPYVGAWSRLARFSPQDLSNLLEQRGAVRMALMRSTIHLVTARDCLWLRPTVQAASDRGLQGSYGKDLAGLDVDEVAAYGRELVEQSPRRFADLEEALGERWPHRDRHALVMAVRTALPLVQVTPRGLWRRSGAAAHATVEQWLGRPLDQPDVKRLVLRYLAAFGPASVADVQKWSGLTRLREVVERLRPQLVELRSEAGAVLYDLPDAPRPDPGTPAPVRLLAEFDNLLLSHADRSRILDDEHTKRLFMKNGIILATVLVDGFPAGTWKAVGDDVEVTTFAPLDDEVAAEVDAEARSWMACAGLSGVVRIAVEA